MTAPLGGSLTGGWSGPADNWIFTAGRRRTPAAQPLIVGHNPCL